MKQPTVIHVGPYDIPVRTLDASAAERNFGEFHHECMEIRLRPTFSSPQQHADTFLHEVMHAVWHVAGCNIKDGEERLVTNITTTLCAVFKQNPDFLTWLQASLKAK